LRKHSDPMYAVEGERTAEYAPPASPPLDGITVETPRVRPRRRWRRLLLLIVFLLLLLVGLPAGLAVLAYEQPRAVGGLTALALPAQAGVTPWNGTDRITILAMGADQRASEQAHSDVMMLVSLDPTSGHVAMLSVPRDLWVQLPEGGEGKINSAYAIGGPRYAALTVAGTLGVPINYYAVLKFGGFKTLIDALGGVTIDVKTPIDDPTYPADVGFGYMPLHIKVGAQHMDGATALAYVRTRHEDPRGDIGRNERQQQVLLALKSQALSPATLLRLPAVLSALQGAVDTNLPHNRLPDVISLLGHAKGANLTREALTPEGGDVSVSYSSDGQWIFLPNWSVINARTQRLLANPALAAEHAVVDVRNGTSTTGLARDLSAVLERDGFTIGSVTQDPSTNHARTQVIVHDPALAYAGRTLAALLQADLTEAPATPSAGGPTAGITVVVGADFPGANP